ncbi:MAG: hypothetical protein ACOC42_02110 [Halobacteriota archaeon]
MVDSLRPTRRAFLASTGIVGLAGCLSGSGDEFEYIEAPDVEFEFGGSNAEGVTITQVDGDEFEGVYAELQGDATFGATPDNLGAGDWPETWSPTTSVEIGRFSIQFGTLEIVWVGDEEPSVLASYDVPR